MSLDLCGIYMHITNDDRSYFDFFIIVKNVFLLVFYINKILV